MQAVENNRVISAQNEAGRRATASWGRGLEGWVGASRAEMERRGALMGLGRLASPAAGPQEALACGLAFGRPATAAVRWADRLRKRRPSPCGLPSPPPPTLVSPLPPHRCSGFREQQALQKQTKTQIRGLKTSRLHLNDEFHWMSQIESICGGFKFRVKHVSTSLLPD